MIVYPDIELKDGKCVNLIRGQMGEPVVYDVDPVEKAREFARDGAEWLHVVDLDAVGRLEHDNSDLITTIIENVPAPVQVAGGIRTMAAVDSWFERGAKRVVIGTAAVKDPQLVKDACVRYPRGIVLSVDVSEGRVVAEGWTETTAYTPLEFARQFEADALAAIIVTDIDRDFDLPDSSFALVTDLASNLNVPVIASGLAKSLDDLSTLKYLPNIAGAIVGRSFYQGNFTMAEALSVAYQS